MSRLKPSETHTELSITRRSDLRSRYVVAVVVGYAWARIAFVLSSSAFETPDTQSYRGGQALRPPVSSALLSWLGSTPFVLVSAIVSTAGFVALGFTLWFRDRRPWMIGVVVGLGLISFMPWVTVYEHWLVPDSLLIGLSLLALALALGPLEAVWRRWALLIVCVLAVGSKEVGIGVVAIMFFLLLRGRHFRLGTVVLALSASLFVTVVHPASSREGAVMWGQPPTSEMTMERFRAVVASFMWSDLSAELAEVEARSADCGMTFAQFGAEIARVAPMIVTFERCPELWAATDRVNQVHVLQSHLRDQRYVVPSVKRAFAPNMWAMASWSDFRLTHRGLMSVDRVAAGALSLLPLAALAICLTRRRGRSLAVVAVFCTFLALAAALVDPSSQDRHTIVFRVLAAALAVIALLEASAPEEVQDPPQHRRDDDQMVVAGR